AIVDHRRLARRDQHLVAGERVGEGIMDELGLGEDAADEVRPDPLPPGERARDGRDRDAAAPGDVLQARPPRPVLLSRHWSAPCAPAHPKAAKNFRLAQEADLKDGGATDRPGGGAPSASWPAERRVPAEDMNATGPDMAAPD